MATLATITITVTDDTITGGPGLLVNTVSAFEDNVLLTEDGAQALKTLSDEASWKRTAA